MRAAPATAGGRPRPLPFAETKKMAKLLALLFASASAFAPAVKPLAVRAATKVAVAPVALDIVSSLPTQLLSLEVTEAAFMAVILGTFIPCFFLVTLYIQSEAALLGERVDENV